MERTGIWPLSLSTTITKLDLLGSLIPGKIQTQLQVAAEKILTESDSVPPMVPVDTGDLQKTGRVEKAVGGWAIVYGGSGVNYANQVHDDLRPRKYKRPGSGPKFVEAHYLRTVGIEDAELDRILRTLVKEVLGD